MAALLPFLDPLLREGRSCTLYTNLGAHAGRICIQKGRIVDAQVAGLKPVSALREILCSPSVEFTLSPELPSAPVTIPPWVSELLVDDGARATKTGA